MSLGGQWQSPDGRDLSWMSGGLDPVAALSAGSCLVNRASVSLGSLTRCATKCTGKACSDTGQMSRFNLNFAGSVVCVRARVSEYKTGSKWFHKHSLILCKLPLDGAFLNPFPRGEFTREETISTSNTFLC